MSKKELIDWFLQRQREGFLSECQISVSQLMDIYVNVKEYARTKDIIRSDLTEIMHRIAQGEMIKSLAVEYKVNYDNFSKYLIEIKKEID